MYAFMYVFTFAECHTITMSHNAIQSSLSLVIVLPYIPVRDRQSSLRPFPFVFACLSLSLPPSPSLPPSLPPSPSLSLAGLLQITIHAFHPSLSRSSSSLSTTSFRGIRFLRQKLTPIRSTCPNHVTINDMTTKWPPVQRFTSHFSYTCPYRDSSNFPGVSAALF